MKGRKVVEIDMGKYKSVELDLEEAEQLLSIITDLMGMEPNDVNETYRILRNFDTFLETMKKKFKDYLVPAKNPNDMILGKVVVDKVKLIREGDKKKVKLIFDRRVPEDVIVKGLKKLGYEVEIKRFEFTA